MVRQFFLSIPFALALVGCPAASEDVRPPSDQLFFPTALAMVEDQSALFVANSNSNRLFSAGTIAALDAAMVRNVVLDWTQRQTLPAELDCESDVDLPSVLVCDEASFLFANATTRLGNFASDLKVQTLADGRSRVLATVRGDPSLTWLDWDPNSDTLECGGEGEVPKCESEHRLATLRGDLDLGILPPEPFGLFVDSQNEFAAMSDLRFGTLTLADLPLGGETPSLTDSIGGFFASTASGITQSIGVASRNPGSEEDILYVTSGTENRVQTFGVVRRGGLPLLIPGDYFFLTGVQGSSDARSIAFNRDGTRAHIVNRNPPMLHVIDTSLGQEGVPVNETRDLIELCPTASNVLVSDTSGAERAYINCFSLGQVWILDPTRGRVVATVNVGQGPYDLQIDDGGALLFVTNYLEDTISVLDLSDERGFKNRMVLKIGRPGDGA